MSEVNHLKYPLCPTNHRAFFRLKLKINIAFNRSGANISETNKSEVGMEIFFKDVVDDMIDKTKGVWPNNSANIVGWLVGATGAMVDMDSYETRKAERQNKPKWNDLPTWVNYLAQDADGCWFCYEVKPAVFEDDNYFASLYQTLPFCEGGEVIGDWRDTLEQRPVVEPAKEFGQSWFDSAVKAFSIIMNAPEDDLRGKIFEKESDDLADWYDYDKQEQVKPIPVGTQCLVSNCSGVFYFCIVRYYGPKLCVVDHDSEKHHDQHYHLSSVKFKPLNWSVSYKDRTIGKALAVGVTAEPQSKRDIMERLYDAKMLVIPEK